MASRPPHKHGGPEAATRETPSLRPLQSRA